MSNGNKSKKGVLIIIALLALIIIVVFSFRMFSQEKGLSSRFLRESKTLP